jgi:hypothetical protein
MPNSITREDAVSDLRALQSVLASLHAVGCNTSAAVRLNELADSIEEQVEPAIQEPKEFGSAVKACLVDGERTVGTWLNVGYGYWSNAFRTTGIQWRDLTVVEVLRTGVAQPSDFDRANMADESARLDEANALGDARAGYRDGVVNTKNAAIDLLIQKRVEATGEHADAYSKAIAVVVEGLS